jgi:hypothetical protein
VKGNSDTIICGKKYWRVGVQLLDNFENVQIGLPHIPSDQSDRRKSRYTVGLKYRYKPAKGQTTSVTEKKSFDEDYELWGFDPTYGKDIAFNKNTNKDLTLSDFFYSFYNICFDKLGTIELTATVKLPQTKTIIKTETVTIKIGNPSIHHMKFNKNKNPFEGMILKLGDCLPPFTLVFYDENNELIPYTGEMKFSLSSSTANVNIATNKKYANNYIVQLSGAQSVSLDERVWKVANKMNGDPIFSKTDIITKKLLSFTLDFLEASGDHPHKICNPFTFNVFFRPGVIHHLAFLNESANYFKNDERIPLLRFICYDGKDNRTFPLEDEKWELELIEDMNSPLEYINKNVNNISNRLLEVIPGTGEIMCLNVIKAAYVEALPAEGQIFNQDFQIYIDGAKQVEKTLSLPVRIIPAYLPTKIKVKMFLF